MCYRICQNKGEQSNHCIPKNDNVTEEHSNQVFWYTSEELICHPSHHDDDGSTYMYILREMEGSCCLT